MDVIKTVILNATDHSVPEYKDEILTFLKDQYDNFDSHSMNEFGMAYKDGEKNMLGDIIKFLENN